MVNNISNTSAIIKRNIKGNIGIGTKHTINLSIEVLTENLQKSTVNDAFASGDKHYE